MLKSALYHMLGSDQDTQDNLAMSIDTDPLELLEVVERIYPSLSVEAKSELRLSIDSLSKRLETPWETTKRIVWQEVSRIILVEQPIILHC